MQITQIYVSQRKLRNIAQLSKMIETLDRGGVLPPIVLSRLEDGSIQVQDGHHRLTAFWLAGRRKLSEGEYLLIETDEWRPRFGTIEDLIDRCNSELHENQNDA